MKSLQKLSVEEFSHMLGLLKRYAETELDQFLQIKFDTEFGKIYLELTLEATVCEDSYNDVSDLMKQSDENKK